MGPSPIRNREPVVTDSREYKQKSSRPQIVSKYQGDGNFHQNWKPGAMIYQPPAQQDNIKDPTLQLMDMSKVDDDFFKANQDVWELFEKYGYGTPKFYVYNDNRARKVPIGDKHMGLIYTPDWKTKSFKSLISGNKYKLAIQPQSDESEESEESKEESLPTGNRLLRRKTFRWLVDTLSPKRQQPKQTAFFPPNPDSEPETENPDDSETELNAPAVNPLKNKRKSFRLLVDNQPSRLTNLVDSKPYESTPQDPQTVSILSPDLQINDESENPDDVTNTLHHSLKPQSEQSTFISKRRENKLGEFATRNNPFIPIKWQALGFNRNGKQFFNLNQGLKFTNI